MRPLALTVLCAACLLVQPYALLVVGLVWCFRAMSWWRLERP